MCVNVTQFVLYHLYITSSSNCSYDGVLIACSAVFGCIILSLLFYYYKLLLLCKPVSVFLFRF